MAHPKLNPIELMWGEMKCYVREKNREFTMSHIKQLAEEKIRSSWGASHLEICNTTVASRQNTS